MKKGYLFYNKDCDRYGIKEAGTGEIITSGLHCGDTSKIYDPAKEDYISDRIEYDGEKKQWYLVVTRKAGNLENLIAKYE